MMVFLVVGFVEVLKNYLFFKVLFDEILWWIVEYKLWVVMFVDYLGMNLWIVKVLYECGFLVKGGGVIKLLFYILL